MRLLKDLINYAILLVFLGVVFYQFRPYIPFLQPAPCTEPIPYNLGNFDERFGLSQEDFLQEVERAEKIWEDASGLDLFAYEPDNNSPLALKLNLIYDYRQEASAKLANIGENTAGVRSEYDVLKKSFESRRSEYERQKKILDSKISAFNSRNAAYEKEVKYWNEQGGAPEEEFKKLEAERVALEKEAQDLKSLEKKVNNLAGEVNETVAALNRLARTLNISVEKYNTINETRGETFEEGIYEKKGISQSINIYEFSSQQKLLRLLAHELGHALQMDHVSGSDSIMYEYNQSSNLSPTSEDLAELGLRCAAK